MSNKKKAFFDDDNNEETLKKINDESEESKTRIMAQIVLKRDGYVLIRLNGTNKKLIGNYPDYKEKDFIEITL